MIKKTYSSEVELFVWMDGLIFDNDDLRAMVIDSILRHEIYWRQEAYKNCVDSSDNQKKHRRMPLTLRDIYILYVIGKIGAFSGKSFDRVVCDSIFRKMYPSSDPICKIVPGETTDEDVKASVEMYCSKNSLSESESEVVWRQIHLLYSIAVKNEYIENNPVQVILDRVEKFLREKRSIRANMVDKSLSEEQEKTIVDHLLCADKYTKRLAVGMLIRIFYGASIGVLCALTWDDYRKIKSRNVWSLWITKRFGESGTVPIPLSRAQHFRILAIIDVIKDMLDELKKEDEAWAEQKGLTVAQFKKLPILHLNMDLEVPYTVQQMRRYEHKLLKRFGPEDAWMYVADGKGGVVEVNNGRYMGDFFAENFKYQAHLIGLDDEEIHYTLGLLPKSTLTAHYLSLPRDTRLLAMKRKLDTWCAKRLSKFEKYDNGEHTITIGSERIARVTTQPTSFPTATEIMVGRITNEDSTIVCMPEDINGMDIVGEWFLDECTGGIPK